MVTKDNKIYLSWEDVDEAITIFCDKLITTFPNIDSIYGIPRGGLIPAVMVSHRMGLPYVNVIGNDTLVMDDICDSGVTLRDAPGVYQGALYHKPHTSCVSPDIWSYIHESDEWLIFPWERTDSETIQDYLKI